MLTALPFYISNIMSCFVKNADARHRLRGNVNRFFYAPLMARVVKDIYGEKASSIKFVRQHTMGRCVCVVNDKYFVKVFRNMSGVRLKNFQRLINYVKDSLGVKVPDVYIAKNNHMYVTEKISGRGIYDFDKGFVLKHEKKILAQVDNIISKLQSIDVHKIPDAGRFCVALESTSKKIKPEVITKDSVLAHFDLNVRNFLFDDDMNICGLIDFDSMAITNDKNKDKQIFMKYWNRYKEKK